MPNDTPRRKAAYQTLRPQLLASNLLELFEPTTPADESPTYSVEPEWIDAAGRTRTWSLKDPEGKKLAEITTKSSALRLAALLTSLNNPDPELPPAGGTVRLRMVA
jgi:hypothetical protein